MGAQLRHIEHRHVDYIGIRMDLSQSHVIITPRRGRYDGVECAEECTDNASPTRQHRNDRKTTHVLHAVP